MTPKLVRTLLAFALLAGCGDDDTPATDASAGGDDVAEVDALAVDAVGADAATSDTMEVDPSLFLAAGLIGEITEIDCTLSDGSSSNCWQITTRTEPSDHDAGPWCPESASDGEEAGGIWPEGGVAYDVTGAFLDELPTFYEDDAWAVVNEDGSVNRTLTLEECEGAARPDVDPSLQNHCVQCLPEHIQDDIENTYVIPRRPALAASPGNINGNVGVAFNGIRFDGPAPTAAILAAYTIAAFDDCGGHINPPVGYHYHAVTTEDCLTTIDQGDGHPGMIGYAMDGFPMYAMLDADGNEPTGLDGCRGHTDDVRGYHYHVSGPGENMILGCWSGLTVQTDAAGGGGGEAMDCATPDATMCCGDGTCDGPETAENCAADC